MLDGEIEITTLENQMTLRKGESALPIFHIANTKKNLPVLNVLKKLAALEQRKTDLYPYEVLSTLSVLWLEFCRVVPVFEKETHKKNSQASDRMAIFLQYIEQHYKENITLEMLAQSANVSKSECLRCFKSTIQSTPYKYLTEYRLSRAADLLKNTEMPIELIASDAGFAHVSHFGKCFREKTGYSPGKYRDNMCTP